MDTSLNLDSSSDMPSSRSEVIATACKRVLFYKHNDADLDPDQDRVIIPRNVNEEVKDAEQLASQKPDNVDLMLAHSLFKSSAMSEGWVMQKVTESTWGRRESIRHVDRRQSRGHKGLTNIVNSLVNSHKLGGRYEPKQSVGELKISRRHLRIIKAAVESLTEDRLAKIYRLKQNIASIDDKYRSIQRSRTPISTTTSKKHNSTSDRTSMPSAGDFNENDVRFEEDEDATEYFRRWVRVVLIVLRWISVILQITENRRSLDKELKSFTDIACEIEASQTLKDLSNTGLSFDKSYFITNKEITLSHDVRKILTLRTFARTPDMLKQVLHGLQTLQSLAEYPLHIQEKLCKVAWYQDLEPRKTIVRQGHYAESFYFILSGQAFVKKMTKNETSGETEMRTVARLTKGQSFGELALLYRTKRTATVESASAMQLLSIDGDDFIRIFTRTGNPDEEPDYIKFLRQIPVFSCWPMDTIRGDPGTCFLHYFKRGSVVTVDSAKSEWIFVIRAGCCEVLQKLRAVKARSAQEINQIRRTEEKEPLLPRDNIPLTTARIQDGCVRKRASVHMDASVYDTMSGYYESIRQAIREKEEAESKRELEENAKRKAQELKKANQSDFPDWKTFKKAPRKVSLTEGGRGSNIKAENKTEKLPDISKSRTSKGYSRSKFSKAFPNVAQAHMAPPLESSLMTMYTRKGDVKPAEPGATYTLSDGSVYVILEVLQARDVFGLDTLRFPNVTIEKTVPTCLVSRGAEIIMLSKKMFIRHSDEATRYLIKENTKRYPTEVILQENLQCEVDWDCYKSKVVGDFLHKREITKTLLPVV